MLHIKMLPGGWSASAYLVCTGSKKYFLKAFDKSRPSSARWIAAIERYIPAVLWLRENTALYGHINAHIQTLYGRLLCEDDGRVYLLSDYTEGEVIGDRGLSEAQAVELARLLGILHGSTPRLPDHLKALQLQEDFDTEIYEELLSFIKDGLDKRSDIVYETVGPHKARLTENILRIKALSDALKAAPPPFVLCHADAHSWNLVAGQRLILTDWECLALAPPEQDLILHMTEPYGIRFLAEYRKHSDDCRPSPDAFEFYYLKRHLEDIWEFIKDLRFDGLVKSKETTVHYMKAALEKAGSANLFRAALESLL